MSIERIASTLIEIVPILAAVAGVMSMVEGMIHSEEYYDRMEKRERAWIERVCIGGPM